MEWLVVLLRRWLGIEAEQMALKARVKQLEDITREQAGSLVRRTVQLESLSAQLELMRRILTTRAPEPTPIRTKTWREAQAMMGDPERETANANT